MKDVIGKMAGHQLHYVLVVVLLIIAFQNCAGNSWFQSGSSSEMSAGGGGGHSYDGKAYIAYGECADGTVVSLRILLTSAQSGTLVRENCADVPPRALGPGDFVFDPVHPERIQYAGLTLVPEPIPPPPTALSKAYFQWNGDVRAIAQPHTYFLTYKNYSSAVIGSLKAGGHTVVCGINAGTVSSAYDPDYALFDASEVGNVSIGSERWLDTRSQHVRSIMMKRLDYSRNVGCDGVLWDQTDAYNNDSGFPLTLDTQLEYIHFLVTAARDRKMLVTLSNMHWLSKDLVGLFDSQYSQNCYQKGYCADFQAFVAAGKPVFITDDGPFSLALCDQARASGYTLWFTSVNQDGTRYEPCP